MNRPTRISLLIALLGTCGAANAQLTSTSGPTAFSGSASVTATASSVASATVTNNNAAIASVGLGQFDPATGLLVGANIQIDSSRTQVISGSGNKGGGPARTANGSGSSTAGLSASGASTTFTPAVTVAGSGCSLGQGMMGVTSCSWGPVNSTATATNGSAGVAAASLDGYVGTGSTSVALTPPSLQATSTLSRTQGPASSSISTYTVNWSGNVQANYSYLLHAAPSFDVQTQTNSLTLDFGTVAQGSSADSLFFTLYNLPDQNRVALDLDSISGSGDTLKLTTDLAALTALEQGYKQSFLADLDTSSVGSFGAHYLLTLSDADVGASSTRNTYQMELNLVGNVAAVPEPETYAMMLAGMGLMGAMARRRRQRGT
jgi:hypothetical protein